MSTQPSLAVLPGRNCDGCALCCKIMGIKELDKPQGEWCTFCSTRQRCDNYDNRPQECRTFNCSYLTQNWIGEEWKPLKSRMVLTFSDNGKNLIIQVDPQRADAWRKAPYYDIIKAWAKTAIASKSQVLVTVGLRFYVIYPDREIDMGILATDEQIIFEETAGPNGIIRSARKMKVA